MSNVLIVTAAAEEFAEGIARLSESPIPVKACLSADQALTEYTEETILFGNPDMIAAVIAKMPTVDWVQSSWAGNTPLMKIDKRDYVLTGIKNVFGPQISEYVIGYLLAHELKVVERLKEQRKKNWLQDYSGMLQGKCIGIMGTGSIGQHIAKTAKYFDMTVSGLSRTGTDTDGFDNVMPTDQLHDFLKDCDYVVSTLPQTDATDNLLDADAMNVLPAHAYFINVGRGNVVDDDALVDALNDGRLAGAALDVFDEEPVPANSPLWNATNLSITAHIAAISYTSLIVPIFIENYQRYVNRQPLKHVIDFVAGY